MNVLVVSFLVVGTSAAFLLTQIGEGDPQRALAFLFLFQSRVLTHAGQNIQKCVIWLRTEKWKQCEQTGDPLPTFVERIKPILIKQHIRCRRVAVY